MAESASAPKWTPIVCRVVVSAFGVAGPVALLCSLAQEVLVTTAASSNLLSASYEDTVAVVGVGLVLLLIPATLVAARFTLLITEAFLAASLPFVGWALQSDCYEEWRKWVCIAFTLGGLVAVAAGDRFAAKHPILTTTVSAWAALGSCGAVVLLAGPALPGGVRIGASAHLWAFAPLSLFLCVVLALSSGLNSEWRGLGHARPCH